MIYLVHSFKCVSLHCENGSGYTFHIFNMMLIVELPKRLHHACLSNATKRTYSKSTEHDELTNATAPTRFQDFVRAE